MGDRRRAGNLLGIACFLGYEMPDWYLEIPHSEMQQLWINGDFETIETVCAEDVRMLRFIDERLMACGWSP